MKLTIVLHTGDFRGDHEADVFEPYQPVDGETVDELVKRVWKRGYRRYDYIRIQPAIVETEENGGVILKP